MSRAALLIVVVGCYMPDTGDPKLDARPAVDAVLADALLDPTDAGPGAPDAPMADAGWCPGNRVVNFGLEGTSAGWDARGSGCSVGTRSLVGRNGSDAGEICKLQAVGDCHATYALDPEDFEVLTTYRLRAWLRSDVPDTQGQLGWDWTTTPPSGGTSNLEVNPIPSVWQEFETDLLIGTGSGDATIVLIHLGGVGLAVGQCFVFDDVCVAPLP